METIFPDPAQKVPMMFRINRAARIKINLFDNGVAVTSTAGWTWRMCLKRFAGDRESLWCLTLNNGLRYEVYTEYTLIADITAANNNIEEGEYYLELERTDLAKTWIQSRARYYFEQ